MAVAGLACAPLFAPAVGAALAATPSATLTESVNVGVRALTVSPDSVGICSPQQPLTLPNGTCADPVVTVTNGPVAGHIDVNGADAVPADQGNNWVLCGVDVGCTGPPFDPTNPKSSPLPGADQYLESARQPFNGSYYVGPLGHSPSCDTSWNPPTFSCAASAGQSANEFLAVIGPTTSSDQSPTFTTSVTWTAAP
jgi:hypothetical protein